MRIKQTKILILLAIFNLNCNSNNKENQRVEILYNNGEYNEVIKICSEVLKKIRSKEALTFRGKSYHNLGMYNEAFNDFYYLYNTVGDTSIATFEGLGLSSLNLKQYDYASHIFKKLIQKDKSNSKNYFYVAIIYIKTKKPLKAINFINDALKIEPNNTKYLNNKGLLLEETGSYRDAIKCFSKIIENGNSNDTFYFNRAANYSHLEIYDSSIIDLSKAISLNKENGFFYYNRAIVYMSINDKEKACLDLKTARSLDFLDIKIEDGLENYCQSKKE